MSPTPTPVVPDPPIPPAALAAAVHSGPVVLVVDECAAFWPAQTRTGKTATADLVERVRRLAGERAVLRDLEPEDVARVLGEG